MLQKALENHIINIIAELYHKQPSNQDKPK